MPRTITITKSINEVIRPILLYTSNDISNNIYGSIYNYNGIFRGKDLGEIKSSNVDSFISNLAISTGEFNVRLGDYFKITDGTHNSTWMVAGINNYYNKGSSTWGNHITLIPRDYLYYPQGTTDHLCPMNSTNTTGVSKNPSNPLYNTTQGNETAGYQAYYGSDMHQIYLPAIVGHLQQVLGNHLLKMYQLLSNTMNLTAENGQYDTNGSWKGIPTNWNWYETYAILPSEIEIYGSQVWGHSGFDTGINCQQLPVFKFIPYNSYSRTTFWLRSVVSSSAFANASNHGVAGCSSASYRHSLRPLICIR